MSKYISIPRNINRWWMVFITENISKDKKNKMRFDLFKPHNYTFSYSTNKKIKIKTINLIYLSSADRAK